MLSVFHMIEWLRQLAFLTGALVGTNLMYLYYGMSLNCVFGFVSIFVGIGARYGGDGVECAKYQSGRADYLTYNIITLFLYMFTCVHHVLIFKIMGAEWCNDVYNEEEEDDDD